MELIKNYLIDSETSSSGDSANVEAKEELVGKIEEKIKTTENPNATVAPDAPEIKPKLLIWI